MIRKIKIALLLFALAASTQPCLCAETSTLCDQGATLVKENKFRPALVKYQHAAKLDSKNADALAGEALCKTYLGQQNEAIGLIDQALSLRPNDSKFLKIKGDIFYAQQKYMEAKDLYDQVVKLAPRLSDAYISRAMSEERLEQNDESLKDATQAVEIDPKSAKAFHVQAIAYFKKEQYDNAVKALISAIELNPADAHLHSLYALTLQHSHRMTDSLPECDRAIALDKNLAAPYQNRARVRFSLGQYTEALPDLNIAIKLDPRNYDTYFERSNAYAGLKKYKESNQDWIKAKELLDAGKPVSKPLSTEQIWALNCAAVLYEVNSQDCNSLCGQPLTDNVIAKSKLAIVHPWKSSTKANLDALLIDFIENDTNHIFDAYGRLTIGKPLDSNYLNNVHHAEIANKVRVVNDYYKRLGEKGLLGWNLARAIHVIRIAYSAGMLDEEEAWARIMPLAARLQKVFSSWEELESNYVIGRKFWSLQETQRNGIEFDIALDKLLNLESSPCRTIPWNLDLSSAVSKSESELISRHYADDKTQPECIATLETIKSLHTKPFNSTKNFVGVPTGLFKFDSHISIPGHPGLDVPAIRVPSSFKPAKGYSINRPAKLGEESLPAPSGNDQIRGIMWIYDKQQGMIKDFLPW